MIDRSKLLVVALLAAAACAAGVAVWVRYDRSDASVALWGAEHADRMRNAPRVDIWRLSSKGDGKEVRAPDGQLVNVETERELRDIRDLSYIRNAFLNDSFTGASEQAECTPVWRYVLRFSGESGSTTLWIDEKCDLVQLGETGVKTTMHAGILNSIRQRFLDRYAPQPKGSKDSP